MRTVLNENFTTKMILETKIKAKEMNLSISCPNIFPTIKDFVKKVTESHFEEKKLVQIRKFETLLATKLHNLDKDNKKRLPHPDLKSITNLSSHMLTEDKKEPFH